MGRHLLSIYIYVCVCVLSTFSNIFSSETTWPAEANFHMESPWDGGMKVCSNGPGHMTKMATMPIYNLKKSSSLEPKGLMTYFMARSKRKVHEPPESDL